MSSTGFEYQVKDVARRARRLVWVHAAGWFTATVCLAALGAGLVDYLVCFRDAGARLISSAGVWLLTFWAVRRFLCPAWRYQCSDLLAARRVERHFPVLRDRLSSALAFASQKCDDELAGSAELRQAVIAETESAARSLPLSDCLDRRRAWRAALVAVLLSGAIAALSLWDGASVALAARRLLLPLGDGPWLRRHVLAFVDPPRRLSTGQDFKVRLVDDKGGLPDRVEIHFWYDGDDQSKIQTEPMPLAGEAFTYRRPNVTRGFRYRATGGDDDAMPWIALDLVEPPRIVEQVVTLHPPSYTGLPPRATEGHFRALRETRVAVRVRVSKPLSNAVLETDTMDSDVPVALELDRDRLGFSLPADAPVPWLVRKSGYYGFHLTHEDGLDVGAEAQWQVEAVSDTPPTASLIQPSGVSRVTHDATVMLEVIVKDDLAIRSVDLVFARSDENGHGARPVALWDVSRDAANGSRIEAGGPDQGVQRMIRYEWDLAGLAGLEPGEWIDFHVAACDNNGQQGESASCRLTIISAGELEERIAQRQSEILAQVAEVARLQKQTRAQINDLEIQLREAGLLGRDD
ncbi:MAG: hypothetical protein FJ276_13700, partial [Planctomycetes bacterium]|nr:hypothetical protein [Planctomycetota bacterium]